MEANTVFKPGKIPIDPGNVYANRGKTEEKVIKSINRGIIPIIYGEYGVGKTSLARYIIKNEFSSHKLVNIESAAKKTISDLFTTCLEKLNYEVTTKRIETNSNEESSKSEDELSFKSYGLFAKSKKTKEQKNQNSTVKEVELFIKSPSDSAFIELCERNKIILLIDELHNATDEFIADLVIFIKTFGNANCKNFKILLLGTSSDPEKLVKADKGIDRLLIDAFLKSMSQDESKKLIADGMKKLELSVNNNAMKKLSKVCVGSPNILQYLCLECAEMAIKNKKCIITIGDVDTAIEEFIHDKASRLYIRYTKAIETQGKNRYRKQILKAISEYDDEYITMEELCASVSKSLNLTIKSTTLSGPLKKLKTSEYGNILKDVEKPDVNEKIQNYSTFVDPELKSFIRMQIAKDTLYNKA